MLSGSNVLVLDEPTNHLDISSKEVVEDALLDFPGTAIVVSHDRYFLNKVPTRILELSPWGLDSYLGAYDYYMERTGHRLRKKYLQELQRAMGGEEPEEEEQEDPAVIRKRNKEAEALARRKERETKKLEVKISTLEEEITFFEGEMCKEEVFTNHVLLGEYHEKLEIAKNSLFGNLR